MGNPLIWVMCVGALCSAILGNRHSTFGYLVAAFAIALLGNIATVWLAIKKAKLKMRG
jgi:hypothetical protein